MKTRHKIFDYKPIEAMIQDLANHAVEERRWREKYKREGYGRGEVYHDGRMRAFRLAARFLHHWTTPII